MVWLWLFHPEPTQVKGAASIWDLTWGKDEGETTQSFLKFLVRDGIWHFWAHFVGQSKSLGQAWWQRDWVISSPFREWCFEGGVVRENAARASSLHMSLFCCAVLSRLVMSSSLWPHHLPGSFVHADSPGKNTGVDCHALLQGIFSTQKSNPGWTT